MLFIFNLLRGALHLREVHALIFRTLFCHRFLSELKKYLVLCDLIVDLILAPGSKCLNGSARPYWRIMLVWKIAVDFDNNNKELWTAVLVMPYEHAAWPYYMANYSHTVSVPRCLLKKVQIDSYMCAACHAFIPFCSMHPEILTIRAPLNGDQLCGHVYVAWTNYSNHSCRQQIKVSWD